MSSELQLKSTPNSQKSTQSSSNVAHIDGFSGLDDTFILMSSAEYESTPILIRHSLPQNLLNDYSQQQAKTSVVEASKNGDKQESEPSTSRAGLENAGGADNPVEIGGDGLNPLEQGADRSVGDGGDAGGSGQPPDGGGGGDGPSGTVSAADESHEQQSGESTTTSGSSMPELVAPPPDPFLTPLMYPAPPLSSPDGPSVEVDQSDDSRASEATTAPMVSDNEGQDQQQQLGVHVVAITNISSSSTSSTNTALLSSSSSSSAVAKQPSEYLDTTVSSMSVLTSTSSSSTKAEKGKSTSDSSGHLDLSKDDKSFDVSKESTTDILSQDMFCGHDEFFVSTPATSAPASRLPFNIEEESEDSEFVVPPSPTELTVTVSLTGQLDAAEENVTQKKARKRPVELTLDTNLPSTEGPSRRTTAIMAAKAKIGDFLIKSMQNAGTEVVSEDVVENEEIDIVSAGVSSRKRQGALSEDVEPSVKVIRKLAFESQTSSDESPKLLITCSDEKPVESSNVPQQKSLSSILVIPTEDKPRGSESLNVAADFFTDTQTMSSNLDDTEEDEVAVEQLILRYSPSQTAESQYFPLVSESCTSDSEKQSIVTPVNVDLSANVVEESSQSDAVPSFNLQRPRSETPSASEGIGFERIDSPVRFEPLKVEAVSEERTKRLVFDEVASDEENPFESYSHKTEAKEEKKETTDAPVCPEGRHKRKISWSENSEEQTRNDKPSTSKRQKPETKSLGCQVDVAELCKESALRKEGGKSTESSIGLDRPSCALDATMAKCGGGDEKDGTERNDYVIRQTVIVRRFFTEELVLRNKVLAKKQYEEEDEPVVKEHYGGSGVSVADFNSFMRPTPPNKASLERSGSSKSTSSLKSSSTSSGVLGDLSSFSKSSSSSSKKDSKESTTTQVTGDMRTLRSVRRRKCYEARKSLKLSESDSTPEQNAYDESDDRVSLSTNIQSPSRKRGRPKASTSRGSSKPKIKVSDMTIDSGKEDSFVAGPSTSTLPVDHSNDRSLNEGSTTVKGVRVMAKWRDGYFYPCRILENENDNRVKIQYADGDIRSIKESDILSVDTLPVGQSVYVMSPDGYYDSSIITESFDEGNNSIGYVVATDSGAIRRVSRDDVILTPDQASCMENIACTPPSRMAAVISLDNLVEGKRRTRGFTPSMSSSPRTPRSTRTPRNTRMNVIDEVVTEVEHRSRESVTNVAVSSGKSDSSAKSETGKLRKSK